MLRLLQRETEATMAWNTRIGGNKMTETRPYVQWSLINDFMVDVFKKYGSPENSARGIVVSLKSKKKQDHFVLKDNIRKIEGVVYMEML